MESSVQSTEKNLINDDRDQTSSSSSSSSSRTHKKRKQDDEAKASCHLVSKVFRSESKSLPFGIANVLQSSSESPKVSATPLSHSMASVNPWIMALHHVSQSSSTTALANASNWCAKCSIQFRLTTELVHHIRLHHATRRSHYHHSASSAATTTVAAAAAATTARKTSTTCTSSSTLTCHICYEIFRERHHLTRHMTSHR